MSIVADARIVATLGSETRASVLAVLASAYHPLTGYRIAKTGGVPIPKAHEQLHRLEKAGVVGRSNDGWVLLDSDFRSLLRKRVQVVGWDDWLKGKAKSDRRAGEILAHLRTTEHVAPSETWVPRDSRRLERDPGKDELLAKMGLKTSRHGRTSRV